MPINEEYNEKYVIIFESIFLDWAELSWQKKAQRKKWQKIDEDMISKARDARKA